MAESTQAQQTLRSWRGARALGLLLVCGASALHAQEDLPPVEDSLIVRPAAVSRVTPWRNQVSLFAGATREAIAGGVTAFTIRGFGEHRFHQWYGVGAVAEVAFNGPRDLVVGPSLLLHPTQALRISLLAAAELEGQAWAFLYRLGGDYSVPVGPGWTLAPSISIDFARGRRLIVAGAALGRTF
jgi:hypothetical protein